MRSPSSAVAVVGITEDTDFADRRDAASAHRGHQLGQRGRCCREPARQSTRRPAKYVAIQRFRYGRHERPRSRRCRSTSPRRDPRTEARPPPRPSASTFPPCPLTKTSRDAQRDADRPNSTSRSRSAEVPIETVPAEALVLTARAVRDCGATIQFDSSPVASRSATERDDGGRQCGCRCPAADGVHAVQWNRRGRSPLMTCSAAASTLRSRARFQRPPRDGRPNSPGVRQLLAHAQQLISEKFSRTTATRSRQSPAPRLYQESAGTRVAIRPSGRRARRAHG